MKHFFFFSLLLALGWAAQAQAPSVDRSFNAPDKGFGSGDSFDGIVKNAVVQRDGKIIIGGDFFSYNGTIKPYLLRLHEDGSMDHTFSTGMGVDNAVYALAAQPNGRVLIGGYFTGYDGVPRNNIARLTRDGSLDGTFDPGEGADGLITTIVLQPDGKILIGGYFTHYNGQERNYIARLNADGSLDETFRPALAITASGNVTTFILQPDGRLVLAGLFPNDDGTAIIRITRLNADGSTDPTFRPKSYVDDTILSIALQKDGRILIAGALSVYNYPTRNHIVRLNADGGLDESFLNIGTDDFTSLVHKIILQDDGRILAAGSFTSYGGQPRNRINRLNADGTNDRSFLAGTAADGEITVMTPGKNGRILIGGDFATYNGKRAVKFTRLDREVSLDLSFNPSTGASHNVTAMALQPDAKLIITGAFNSYFGERQPSIARLQADGAIDSAFDPGTGANELINTVTTQPDGKILIGGYFTSFNGSSRNHIARLNTDGSVDRFFNCSTDYPVSSIVVQRDGKILIGGSFTTVDGAVRNRIARLNANGTVDAGFNPGSGANGGVAAISVQPDGKILIGGYFSSYNGVARSRVARLNADGTLDTGFSPSTAFLGGHTASIVLQPDGRILIGGNLYPYDVPEFNLVIRLNSDGGYDESFDAGTGANGPVHTMVLQRDGMLLLGGYFTSFNGLPANYLARLTENGMPDAAYHTGIGASDYINSVLLQQDARMVIAGAFTSFNGTGRNCIARLINEDTNAGPIPPARINYKRLSPPPTLAIYPIPVTHTLHVTSHAGTKMSVAIFDNSGRKIYEGDLQGEGLSIDVSGWTNGGYHLVATDASGRQKTAQSFIKQ